MLQKFLLPVIVILIATGVILLLNPAERLREVRDNQRVEDLTNIKNALETYISNNAKEIAESASTFCINCQTNVVYSYSSLDLTGSFQNSVKQSSYVNGSGWIPLDLSKNAKIGATPLKILPVDPLAQSNFSLKQLPLVGSLIAKQAGFNYSFSAGKNAKYKLTAKMESKKNLEAAASDGGTQSDRLELGTDLNLKP